MITKDNPSMNSVAESIYLSEADFIIREQCRRREDAIAHEKYQKEQIQSLTVENAALTVENTALTTQNASLASENERLRSLLAEHGIDPEQ